MGGDTEMDFELGMNRDYSAVRGETMLGHLYVYMESDLLS